MFKWFKEFFASQPEPQLPVDRDAQNAWIDARLMEWQVLWHDLFDADRNLMAMDEFDRPAPLPAQLDTDYRLMFGLARTTPETQEKCFALFPAGKEMQRRYAHVLSATRVQMPEADARSRLGEVIALIGRIAPHRNLGEVGVRVVDQDTDEGND
ncbi:MAG: hypothetical protein ACRC6I_15210, partial [Paracoccaceae bacterium]